MTSKRTTAIEELRERVDTLDKQIERTLERAGNLRDACSAEVEHADGLKLLRTQYKNILAGAK